MPTDSGRGELLRGMCACVRVRTGGHKVSERMCSCYDIDLVWGPRIMAACCYRSLLRFCCSQTRTNINFIGSVCSFRRSPILCGRAPMTNDFHDSKVWLLTTHARCHGQCAFHLWATCDSTCGSTVQGCSSANSLVVFYVLEDDAHPLREQLHNNLNDASTTFLF